MKVSEAKLAADKAAFSTPEARKLFMREAMRALKESSKQTDAYLKASGAAFRLACESPDVAEYIRLTREAERAQDAARIASGSVALNMSIALADELERDELETGE